MPDTEDCNQDIAGRLLSLLPQLQHTLKRDRMYLAARSPLVVGDSGLSGRRGQYRLLGMLMKHGRMTTQQLAELLDVAPPTVSTMLRHLTESGFVDRERDGEDQRIVWVSVSDSGREEMEAERLRWRTVFLQRLEQLDDEDRQRIADAIPALERLVETTPHPAGSRGGHS